MQKPEDQKARSEAGLTPLREAVTQRGREFWTSPWPAGTARRSAFSARLPRTPPYVPTASLPTVLPPLMHGIPLTPHPHFSATAHAGEAVCGLGEPQEAAPPRTTLSSQHRAAHGLPAWSLGCVPLRVLALQPCRQHIFHTRPVQDRRTGQTCPPAPAPLFPDPSERKRGSCVSTRGYRSPVGSPVSVCACAPRCARAHEHAQADRSRQAPAVPAGGDGSPASSTPPTVRSSWGLKKEDSYPRGSTCKEHLALLGFLERERR